MSERRFGPYGLDAALEVTKQLQQILLAEVVDVETDEERTTIFLAVPAAAVARTIRLRRWEWVSFVNENIRRRKEVASRLIDLVAEQRRHLVDSYRVAGGVAP